jgi:hypothetical protein
MTTRKPRVPAHMLRSYYIQYRPMRGESLQLLDIVRALSSTGALVQAAHMLARNALLAVEIVATEQGE